MIIHVTGATGFVGRSVVREAQRRGHDVVALVRKRGSGLAGVEEIEVGDISTRSDWSAAVEGADAIIHLAARVHVMNETIADVEAEYARVNTAPTVALAQAAEEAGVSRFVFMSSIKVNGERTTTTPFDDDSVPAPVDPYGRSKLAAEEALRTLGERGRTAVTVLRPTVVYGPDAGGNIARIAGAVRRGVPLPLGSVRNSRTMLSVKNLAVGTVSAAESASAGFGVHVLGDPTPISTRRLVELLGKGLGVKPRLLAVPTGLLRLGGRATGRGADIARLVEDLEVRSDWAALGVRDDELVSTDQGMAALGRALRHEQADSGGRS